MSYFSLSCLSLTGMGSGGSAGKDAGPLKALLRQQTQSALEQRVRQPMFICACSRAVNQI